MELDASAVLWSAPERDRANRPLLVLMHGLGSHEGDLFGMSPRLPLKPVIASLRAPLRYDGGWSWFERGEPGRPDPSAVDASADAVLAWLDTLDYTSVSLLGFSQGGAMALQLLRRAPRRFSAAVNLSGFLAPGEQDGDVLLTEARPPVFWGRGTLDTVIPADAIARTEAWLPTHTDATVRIYEDLGHSVSHQELSDLAAFLGAHP